jgi:hypothetical protein
MPTASDLVTDLPADFETFGQAVATSMADLLGGTSGQILSKASNTDMDFTWITNDVGDITAVTAGTGISGGGTSGAVTITNSMATAIDAKGDLVVGTGADAFSRLAIGANNTVPIADSAEATGIRWGGAWTTWTPSYTNLTVGNGTVTARYSQVGKTVTIDYKIFFVELKVACVRHWFISQFFKTAEISSVLGKVCWTIYPRLVRISAYRAVNAEVFAFAFYPDCISPAFDCRPCVVPDKLSD